MGPCSARFNDKVHNGIVQCPAEPFKVQYAGEKIPTVADAFDDYWSFGWWKQATPLQKVMGFGLFLPATVATAAASILSLGGCASEADLICSDPGPFSVVAKGEPKTVIEAGAFVFIDNCSNWSGISEFGIESPPVPIQVRALKENQSPIDGPGWQKAVRLYAPKFISVHKLLDTPNPLFPLPPKNCIVESSWLNVGEKMDFCEVDKTMYNINTGVLTLQQKGQTQSWIDLLAVGEVSNGSCSFKSTPAPFAWIKCCMGNDCDN